MKHIIAFLILLPSTLAATGGRCPPTGAVLPPPKIPRAFPWSDLTSSMDGLNTSNTLTWNMTTTSFSVGITSAEHSAFMFHHTAPVKNETGTSKVDSDTIYRIASITKAFSSLAMLLNAEEYLDSRVKQFIPELQDSPQYDSVTLRMLASQQAGVPRDSSLFDLYVSYGDELQKFGFPKPDPHDIPTCDVPGKSRPCNRKAIAHEPLVWLPDDRAAYSSLAFVILGWAMENITGKPFMQILDDSILKPLDLSSTGMDAPANISRAIIPAGQGAFVMGYDLGNYNSTAGLYSTPSDVLGFVRSVIKNTLLSPTRTRQWLKPAVFAGGLLSAVGMPWEIFRLSNLTSDKRQMDMYTKSGDIFGYSTYMFVLPEFNVGGTVLVAGDQAHDAVMDLMDIVIPAVGSSLDRLARDQAQRKYAGQYYEDNHGNSSSGGTATLTLAVDDGPGLKVEGWTNRGKSILAFWASNRGTTIDNLDAGLYPVGEGDRWRLAVEILNREPVNPSIFSDECLTWLSVDEMRYVKQPVDGFRFQFEGETVKGVTNLGLRANLTKHP